MIIAVYIVAIAYIAFRESSLILLDACESPELTSALAAALKTVEGIRGVTSIRLRPSGQFLTGIIAVLVDGSKSVTETEQLRKKLLEIVSAILEPVGEMSIVFRSDTQS